MLTEKGVNLSSRLLSCAVLSIVEVSDVEGLRELRGEELHKT